MFGQRGATVKIVNRVRNDDGTPVPVEIMVGGEQAWVRDTLELPVGIARIAIHQTMFRLDPVTNQPEYKLGCDALGADESPVPVAETQRSELIDRRLLPPDRQLGAKDKFGRTLRTVPIHNPINPRRDAGAVGPRPTEGGVHPGEFGDRL